MKILKIESDETALFKNGINIDFTTTQRVSKTNNEMLYKLKDGIYTNNVLAFVGINASGKTTTLSAISFILKLITNNSINDTKNTAFLDRIILGNNITFTVYLLTNKNQIVKLVTTIGKLPSNSILHNNSKKYYIDAEEIFLKKLNSNVRKSNIFDFEDDNAFMSRDNESEFLAEDISIMISLNKKNSEYTSGIDLTSITNYNVIDDFDHVDDFIKLLDPNIEYIKNTGIGKEVCLKFINQDDLKLSDYNELEKYLSAGTIKGLNILNFVRGVLSTGSYLIVDDIENHINIEIVTTIIKMFMDSETNPYGASLIFSTHYLEIIDILERNDSVYFINNKEGIDINNLSLILHRNDLKKSDVFLSGYLNSTTPSYEAYMNLRKNIKNYVMRLDNE